MVSVTLYLVITLVALLAVCFKYLYRRRRKGEPEIVPGNILWGNGKQFAEDAVAFLHKSQAKFGDVFTIRLLNQHLTIINDPHTYERFCKEKTFDFDQIQEQVNMNVFSFKIVNSRAMIKEAGKTVKGQNLISGMRQFSRHLNDAFTATHTMDVNGNTTKDLLDHEWKEDGLRNMASKTMFQAIFRTVFGTEKPDDVFKADTVYRNFDIYHKYFNFLWLGLPVKLFPEACRALEVLIQQPDTAEVIARDDVSPFVRFSVQHMKAHNQPESDILGYNLVYLHVNYNTFRVTYWFIYMLMTHPEALEALAQEVKDTVERKSEYYSPDDELDFDMEEIDSLPVLNSILSEVIRLTSGVFMVRAITKDTTFTTEDGTKYNLREGDRVAMYPPAIHKDPEIFEEPMEFKYDRFIDAKFYKKGREVKNPLLAFGSLCPGKKMAILQAKWYMFNLVHQCEFDLLPDQKTEPDARYHGHEILPPTNDVRMKYRLKENHRKLAFV